MEHEEHSLLPEPPAGFRWHDTARFGFAVAVPRRFHLLANTVDPVARLWRHCDDQPDDAAGGAGEPGAGGSGCEPGGGGRSERTEERWAAGLWDLEVIGELPDGRVQPFRLLEFDAIGGRDFRLPADDASMLWFQARSMFTETLEALELPGCTSCFLRLAIATSTRRAVREPRRPGASRLRWKACGEHRPSSTLTGGPGLLG